MASSDSHTAVFIGNLKPSARIGELKTNLHKLLHKSLKIKITLNDISLINGTKRYAIVDVHNQQNVDYLLENLIEFEDRQKIKFDFCTIVDKGVFLHVDTVKSDDEKQARDDFENAKNHRPFQKLHRFPRNRPDFGRAISVKSLQSSRSSTTGGRSSRQSTSTIKGANPVMSESYHSDLDVTIDEGEIKDASPQAPLTREEIGEVMNLPIHMIPVADSILKDDSDDSGTQMENPHNHSISTIGDESPVSEYEDPPGSVIDLRHISRSSMISRASMNSRASMKTKVTPKIHRRQSSVRRDSKSALRRDFFKSLDRQIGIATPATDGQRTNRSYDHDDEEGTPYFKAGEIVYNQDMSKEFKAYTGNYTLKQMREHVARCICGYLNSGQRGMLLVGVQTNGVVVGIECDAQQEERYRKHFMDAAKEIYPPIFAEDYSIHFSPLLEDNGRQHPTLKVIEVRVIPPQNADVLYECKEGVFVRRNGVLAGPIRPSHIQEWIKEKHFSEMGELREQESFLKEELDNKDLMIRRQADTIVAQKSEIDHQRALLQESKSCTIL